MRARFVYYRVVKGQEHIKRDPEAGTPKQPSVDLNVLMAGPPGAGKTLQVRALPSILPRMTIDEALDVTRVYWIGDILPGGVPLVQHQPLRSRHHKLSHLSVVGCAPLPAFLRDQPRPPPRALH